MKTSHIFWGLLFISLGLLVLINNFTTIFMDWGTIWKLWPLVIVLLGLSILIKHKYGKSIMAGLAAIILALAIFASFKSATNFISNDFEVVFGDESDYEFVTTEYSEKYDSTLNYAVLNFGAGAGSFNISDTTSQLFFANTEGRKNSFELRRYDTDSSSFINFDMEGASFRIGDKGYKNRVEMSLNPNPVWDLNFDVGASSMDFDLTQVKTRDIDVDMGAASLNIKLGNLSQHTNLIIEAGASDIDILVPLESGCRITTDGALSSKRFKEFDKKSSGLYETENFKDSANKIYIEIDSGVSSISVERY
jgi:hypothetical protein